MKLQSLPIGTSILVTVWSLYGAVGLFSLVSGEFSIVRLAMLALVVITIVALIGKAGEWARIAGLVFSGLLLLAGLAFIGFGVWSWVTGRPELLALALIGIGFAGISAWTIWTLRRSTAAS